jgi:hypothetical protein
MYLEGKKIMLSDKVLLLAYMSAVFMLNFFIYMIAEYYRRAVNKKLNPTGFVISMCAISVAIGGLFVSEEAVLVRIITASMLTTAIASLLNGIELYFFTRYVGE